MKPDIDGETPKYSEVSAADKLERILQFSLLSVIYLVLILSAGSLAFKWKGSIITSGAQIESSPSPKRVPPQAMNMIERSSAVIGALRRSVGGNEAARYANVGYDPATAQK